MHYLRKLKELTEYDKVLLKKYLKCRELMVINEQVIDRETELEMLRKQVEILKMENFLLTEEKSELLKQMQLDENRLLRIFKLIEEHTEPGYELIVERKMRKFFDS